jgi:thiol-disulfide isomerase/thioredoxin
MATVRKSLRWTLVLFTAILPATTARTSDRPAEQILKELDAITWPVREAAKRKDQRYLEEFSLKFAQVRSRRDALIVELYKVAPQHERIPKLMLEHWARLIVPPPNSLESLKEIDEILARDSNPRLKIEGTYIKAVARIRLTEASGAPDLSEAEEFIKLAPMDQRGSSLLRMAGRGTRDKKQKAAIEDRAIKDYPSSPYAEVIIRERLRAKPDQRTKEALEDRALMQLPDTNLAANIVGERRRRDAIGKPFDLVFVDTVQGQTISIERLKGTVVIIDFWATWCPPCVAEMPHLKELYAKYHDQGVEFIGISLDRPETEGGLDRLKKFVKDNAIAWPQYYQGDGGRSGFSKSWGIQAIPAVFVVDADGKLCSDSARGKLEEIIPELLKKKLTVTSERP